MGISDIVSEKYNNWNPMCILFNYIQSDLLLALIVSIIYLYISTIVTLYRKDGSSRVSAMWMIVGGLLLIGFLYYFYTNFLISF